MKDLLKKARAAVDIRPFCQSGPAKIITVNGMVDYFNQMHEKDLDEGRANPFIERRKRGRPSLEKLIRQDLAQLWDEDFARRNPRVGFLSALLFESGVATRKPGEPVKLKFIQRGHEG